jgi:dihydroorotate dehydrogenase electron transfer subunit
VQFNRALCREHYLLRLRTGRRFPPTGPGQFVQLGCRPPNGFGDRDALLGRDFQWVPGQCPPLDQPELCGRMALLRRPFSLAGRGDDAQGTWLDVIHRVVGVGTEWLAQRRSGDPVDLIGPLGNRFTPRPVKSLGLLVGGGVGLPPMLYLAEALQETGWSAVAFVGARSRDLLPVTLANAPAPDPAGCPRACVVEFARLGFDTVVTTDDGSLGLRGTITQGLERFLRSQAAGDAARAVVFTCGPDAMMRAAAELARRHHLDCQVCVEQAMACGMGTCQSCVVKVRDPAAASDQPASSRLWRYRLACADGPVFPAEQLVW